MRWSTLRLAVGLGLALGLIGALDQLAGPVGSAASPALRGGISTSSVLELGAIVVGYTVLFSLLLYIVIADARRIIGRR